jgi:hypothetical protein
MSLRDMGEKIIEGIRFALSSEEEESTPGGFALAETGETAIACAKSGKFEDMNGNTVVFTPTNLSTMVFDPAEEHKLKVGHVPIKTDTSDFGDIKRIQYDVAKDRLFAFAAPTPAGVKKNREEGFRRCSLEGLYYPKRDQYEFTHLAMLAAKKPAVPGLETFALSTKGEEECVRFALSIGDEPEAQKKPVEEPKLSASMPGPKERKESDMADEKDKVALAEAERDRDAAKKEAERLRKHAVSLAQADVPRVIEANVKKIPVAERPFVLASGMRAAEESAAPDCKKVSLAQADGKEPLELTPYDLWKRGIESRPDQVTAGETTQLATPDKAKEEKEVAVEMSRIEGRLNPEFSAEPESVKLLAAAEAEIKTAKEGGEVIDLAQAADRIYRRNKAAATR